ncbi:MAG: hypothetical protein EBU54_14795 [Mycobacteriaceae bacterium]|nr:hypothetical protein [Mycobacteriaceae bacterium]
MDAHANEYAGAAAGMNETYRPSVNEPAVGDFISGTTCGKQWSGRVEWCDGTRVTINVGGGWLAVPVADITH